MAGLSQEERLFLELARKRGAISQAHAQVAKVKATSEGSSVVETLTSMGALTIEDADALRRELEGLAFACLKCGTQAYRAPSGELPVGTEAVCPTCAGKTQAEVDAAPPTEMPLDPERTVGPDTGREPAPAPIASGQVIGGCQIEQQIGRGGMSIVYRAHHLAFEREVAVKVLDQRLVTRQGFVEQFLTEARALAQLDHPNVVRFFEAARDDVSGLHYLVMELLEGGSVQSAWERAHRRLPVREVVRIAAEAAKGLAHAHDRGLVHRDVKPANLMFDVDGHVKVVDFGVAIPAQKQVFVATEIVGTLHYMAPEQIDGLPLDARTDQYALGATLFQLLCGRLPFEKKRSVDVLFAHVNEAPPKPRELREDVPEWLEGIVLKLLAKDRVDRFESLKALGEALETGERSSVGPVATTRIARPSIHLEEINDLETGSRRVTRPVLAPRRAWVAVAASLAASLLFLLLPARLAVFSRAEAQPREVAVVVQDALGEAEVLSNASGDDAGKLDATVARLDADLLDLASSAGVAKLQALRASVAARLEKARSKAMGELSGRVSALLESKHYAAAIDAAALDSEAARQGIGTFARDLAAKGRAVLAAERGEVYVAAGDFRHGAQGEKASLKGFYLDRTEVSNADWETAVAKHGLEAPLSWPGGKLDPARAQRPVTEVSFEEAGRYARAMGKRLPSSLEWEKAARGDRDARAWPWGEVFERGRANLADGGSGALEDVAAREGDVSPSGALGLAGNALEWVLGEQGPLVAGGGFRSQASSARVWERLALAPGARHAAIGFRCARDVESN